MKQQDLRVVKTVNNIESTFIALLEEQGFASITVQDILDRALINRKTFYRYYRDKYDLAETVIRKFFEEINGYFLTQQQETEKCGNRDTDLLDEAYQALYRNKRMILALWNVKTTEVDFYSSLLAMMQQKYRTLIVDSGRWIHDLELQSFLTATLMLQSMKYLLEHDEPLTPEKLLTSFRDTYTFLTNDFER